MSVSTFWVIIFLGEIDENLGSGEFGDIVNILGSGTQQTWVRNSLTADVRNVEYKGGIELQRDDDERGLTRSHFVQWSAKWQQEDINDKINEWERPIPPCIPCLMTPLNCSYAGC